MTTTAETLSVSGLITIACQRMQGYYDRHRVIDDTLIQIVRNFEAMIAKAQGDSTGIDGTNQRCLNREPGTTACRRPVDHIGDCDLRVDPAYMQAPPIRYDNGAWTRQS